MRPSLPSPGTPAEQFTLPQPRLGYLAAEFTGISVKEFESLRRKGGGPDFCHVSRRLVRYAVEDICGWLDSSKVSNNAQAAARAAGQGVARA